MKKITFSEYAQLRDPKIALHIINKNLTTFLSMYDPEKHSDSYHITIVCKKMSIIIKMLVPEITKPSYIIYAYLKEENKGNMLLFSIGMTYMKNLSSELYLEQLKTAVDVLTETIERTIYTFQLDTKDMIMITNLDEADIKTPWHKLNIKRTDKKSLNMFLKWIKHNLGETTKTVRARCHIVLYPNTINQIEGYYNYTIEKSRVFDVDTYNLVMDLPLVDNEYYSGLTFEDLSETLHNELDSLYDKLKPMCINDDICDLEYYCY